MRYFLLLSVLSSWSILRAQDSVLVTFFYKPSGNPAVVYVPGEFNNWGPNLNGVISPGAPSQMTKDPVTGVWSKSLKLRVGGPSPLPAPFSIAGAYQYKFNENGTTWLQDPLNPRENPLDNNNSYLFIKSPTIHYLLPNELSGLQQTSQPEITAYIFPSTQWAVDTSSITVTIDSVVYDHLGSYYDTATKRLSFMPPIPFENGTHALKLEVKNASGSQTSDSTFFYLQGGFVQFLTLSNRDFIRPAKLLEGLVEDPSISEATIKHNDDSVIVQTSNGTFSYLASLLEGDNVFRAKVIDSLGVARESSPVTITYKVNHSPKPTIQVSTGASSVLMTALPNDPDGDAGPFTWTSDDAMNPEPLNISTSAPELSISMPGTPGEYYFDLTVTDALSNSGTARAFFVLKEDGAVEIPTINSNPAWVEDAVVYEIYVPAFSSVGNLDAITERLGYLRDLGVNAIWLMPIYENGETIDELNAGYNITDFYRVHPQLGTMEDFDELISAAHSLGIRVILDSTPNHVSGDHKWINDIGVFRNYSNYRPMVETRILGGDRGLGQSATNESGYTLYVHYSNWSLANLNYDNVETSAYMLDMYKWWLLERGVDGYRMDVYWGPEERYGKTIWWRPLREEVKRVKPEAFILGETDGTGIGSESNYADGGGASDAAYDWNLYGQIKSTLSGGSLTELDNRVRNFSTTTYYNEFTGSNAHYFRFLENHDESRIASLYSTPQVKSATTLLLTAPGIPMLYAGQEVGETSRRGRIVWNRTGSEHLFRFSQRLITARRSFVTFRSAEIVRITSNHNRIYSYLRPYLDQNAIVAINFSGLSATASLVIPESSLRLSAPLDSTRIYYMNDVQNDTSFLASKSDLSRFSVTLPPWGSVVFLLSDTLINLNITEVEKPPVVETRPSHFLLHQNYPNPFNPATTISYELPRESFVRLVVYDLLGREVTTLVDQFQQAGQYRIVWDGTNRFGISISTGVYIYRIQAGDYVQVKRMVLSR